MAEVKTERYRTYFTDVLEHDSYHVYFKVDRDYPVGDYEYLTAYRGDSVYYLAQGAFQTGRFVELTIGGPYRELDGKAAATIKSAEVVWQPSG